MNGQHPNAELLTNANKGFDYLFSNDIDSARAVFEAKDDPFHMLGLGVCAFLEAALGMESALMTEASRCLALSEAGTRKQMRHPKPRDLNYQSRFRYGLEWEILNADAVVLLGLTNALSESYMGYLQCMYSLNSAHSKFTKLYKTVFPTGLPTAATLNEAAPHTKISASPSLPLHLAHKPSTNSISSRSSVSSVGNQVVPPSPSPKGSGFFSRWLGPPSASASSLPLQAESSLISVDGPVEDLIVSGTAFGYGLFNLVFSLLPKKIQGLVGFFGFQHDRKLALQALAVSARREDVHAVFAGLVLMTYHGVVLLLSGYQADEPALLAEYKDIVDRVETRYPSGALWILNRAKIMRMSYNAEGSIATMQQGLQPNRPHSFAQADMLLIFELAWTLLGQRRYQEAADTFMKITQINSWSHATYYFITAGCYTALENYDKAQSLLDAIPDLIDKKKISGKDLPTEVFIKKKLAFYKAKQVRRAGHEKDVVQAVKISPAEEIAVFWNTHARIDASIAQAHIDALSKLSPPTTKEATRSASISIVPAGGNTVNTTLPATNDLDTVDELAIRALLLGIHYRTLKVYETARSFLLEAHGFQSKIETSTWVGGLAMFELAVLDLKELDEKDRLESSSTDRREPEDKKMRWAVALREATSKLDVALGLATSSVDLSSRLDSRIVMLKDQIAAKRDSLGIVE